MFNSTPCNKNLGRPSEPYKEPVLSDEDNTCPLEYQLPTPDFVAKLKKLQSSMQKFIETSDIVDKLNVVYLAHELIMQFPEHAGVVIEFIEKQPSLGRELKFTELSKEWLKLAYKKESAEPTVEDFINLFAKKCRFVIDRIKRAIGDL